MGSALPKADESLGWPNLPCCPHRHPVSVPCPPTGTWLVLALCPACTPAKGLYCRTHRDRHAPAPHALPAPEQDVRGLAAGEREDAT